MTASRATGREALRRAQIEVVLGGTSVESRPVTELAGGGPLGSLRWLVASLALRGETLRPGMLVLTGSAGGLFPVQPGMTLAAECAGQRVEANVRSQIVGAEDKTG